MESILIDVNESVEGMEHFEITLFPNKASICLARTPMSYNYFCFGQVSRNKNFMEGQV